MNAVKVDEAHRIQVSVLRPGDYYEPEVLGDSEVLLRKVQPPRGKFTFEEAMAAIENSPLRFTKGWDEIIEGNPVILFDSSVIIDARDPDSPFHDWAKRQIAAAVQEGSEGGAVNTIVISEVSVRAKDRETVPALLEGLGLNLVPLPVSTAIPASKAFAVYLDRLKKEGKRSENRIPLPDFLIGAHAEAEGMKLITRDPDRIKTYFPGVKLITP